MSARIDEDRADAKEAPPAAKQAASFTLHGTGVAAGIAIGRAHLVSSARLEVDHTEVSADRIEEEIGRFDSALGQVRGELIGLRASVPGTAPAEMNAFLDLHLMILADPHLAEAPRELIRTKRFNAEWALVQQIETLVEQFERIEDPYLRERKQDIQQVGERILRAMPGARRPEVPASSEEGLVVVAHDLSPADMVLFREHHFGGFVTDLGGATSHTAIVARSLGIPAIVGMHHARSLIRENELVIVDGREGVLIVNPDAVVLAEYQALRTRIENKKHRLLTLRTRATQTEDGVAIELHANIEFPPDVKDVQAVGAAGIGLFRSEFLFLNRADLPGEEEQFEAYRRVVLSMDGLPVTIRTLDLGADKTATGMERAGPNPALGLRAIRYCLAEPNLFHAQLRAILRASHYGRVRLLIPMLAHTHEVEQTFAALKHARESLQQEGIPYDAAMPVGGMVEVPAAALSLGYFVKKLDFLSIGTNDLIQYTLAIDRDDDAVAHLYDPLHPAVLQLVALTIRTADRAGKPVAVCGEMAGDLIATRLLLGFGLRQFSMHSAHLLEVKQQLLRSRFKESRALAARILRAHDPRRRARLIAELNA